VELVAARSDPVAAAGGLVLGVRHRRAVEVGGRLADVLARDDLPAGRVQLHDQRLGGGVLVGAFDLPDDLVGRGADATERQRPRAPVPRDDVADLDLGDVVVVDQPGRQPAGGPEPERGRQQHQQHVDRRERRLPGDRPEQEDREPDRDDRPDQYNR
jgi:hypothetical protein